MWVVKSCPAGWWCADNAVTDRIGWPNANLDASGYVSEGTAILMCDVLNARDYPDVES